MIIEGGSLQPIDRPPFHQARRRPFIVPSAKVRAVDRVDGPAELRIAADRHHAQRVGDRDRNLARDLVKRSEEHTSELQSLMRISYAVFCLKKKKDKTTQKL